MNNRDDLERQLRKLGREIKSAHDYAEQAFASASFEDAEEAEANARRMAEQCAELQKQLDALVD